MFSYIAILFPNFYTTLRKISKNWIEVDGNQKEDDEPSVLTFLLPNIHFEITFGENLSVFDGKKEYKIKYKIKNWSSIFWINLISLIFSVKTKPTWDKHLDGNFSETNAFFIKK